MSDEQFDLDAFATVIRARITDLESVAQGSAEAAQTVELDQQKVGRVSRMDALQQQAMGKESERRRKLELRRLAAALERIAAGEFGYCLTCDELIALPRLNVDPASTQCIACARKAE